MNRVTKLIVFVWAVVALAAIVYFSRGAWPRLPLFASLAFVGMGVAALTTSRAVPALLVFTYVFPIIVRYVTGVNYSPLGAVWTAGLLGVIAPDALRGWQVPLRWRPVLVCWALTVVVAASIVAARESDFTWNLLFSAAVANSWAGGWPSFVVTWSLHVAVVLLAGILWFDWLCGQDPVGFRAVVAMPLALSAAVMVVVALYQLVVDVSFLNPGIYGALGRASGTIMDANLCGTIAGLWIGGAVLLFASSPIRYRVLLVVVSIGACWLAVWASGSRTGLATATVVSLFVANLARKLFGTRTVAAGLAGAIVLAVMVALQGSSDVVGPLRRLQTLIPTEEATSLRSVAYNLWNRGGYGAIAAVMISEHPFVGVGIGGYHFMQADFAKVGRLTVLSPDNAQNWYRHQLAEFGLLGSLGWIAWVAVFGAFLFGSRESEPAEARLAQGMILTFAAISLVGSPGQEMPAAITFWTFAFWVLLLRTPAAIPPRSWRWSWTVVGVTLALFFVGTASAAVSSLRVPARAQRIGWNYEYGFHARRPTDGEGRWTGRHAVAVFEASTRHMRLTVTPNRLAEMPAHRVGGRSPLRIDVRVNQQALVAGDVMNPLPITQDVHLPDDARYVFLEIRTNQTFQPSTVGLGDNRQLGLLVNWTFLDSDAGATSLR
jgi:O-antigen ligase